jgi:hypothetical protein
MALMHADWPDAAMEVSPASPYAGFGRVAAAPKIHQRASAPSVADLR